MKTIFYLVFSLFTLFSFPQTWQSAYDSCLKYQEQQKFKIALEWGDKALELYEKQVAVKDTNYSNILNRQFENCYYAGLYKEAESYARKDSLWVVKNIGKITKRYATACSNLGVSYQSQGEYTKAELFFVQAKRTDSLVLGKNHSEYAADCNNLAHLYHKMGKLYEAQQLYQEVLTNFEYNRLLSK